MWIYTRTENKRLKTKYEAAVHDLVTDITFVHLVLLGKKPEKKILEQQVVELQFLPNITILI